MSSIEYSFSIAFSRASVCQKGLTISDVARHLDGVSPADLQVICTAAKRMAFNRMAISDQLPPLLWSDFEVAVVHVRGN
jgi:hypothetical protein